MPQSTASHLFARTRSFHRPTYKRPGAIPCAPTFNLTIVRATGDEAESWIFEARVSVALLFRPAWQTCLTPFDQLYVLLFLPIKMRCDRVFRNHFTMGWDGASM